MHAILASLGTDGDVLPFIGVGAKLRARGHRVTLAAAEDYAGQAEAHGLEFSQLVTSERMRDLLGNADFWHPIKTARFTGKWGASLIEPQYRLLKSLANDADSVLVTNPAILAAAVVAEELQRPSANIVLQPWVIKSAIAPPIMPMVTLPQWAPPIAHRIAFRAIDFAADCLVGPTLNGLRKSVGLKPMRRIVTNWFSPRLVLGMFPDWFGPPQTDWPKQIRLTGFPLFDGAIKRRLPANILGFLSRKKPTVIFTFGSGMMHARELCEAASRICGALDLQGLLINRHYTPDNSPPHMLSASFLPFSEIFPRCAAVVHHGGVGTMAEAFASATPQLILPLGFDQLDNGVRVQKLGVGLHTRSKHNLVSHRGAIRTRDIEEITAALRRLLTPEFRANALSISKRVTREDALEMAATCLEELERKDLDRAGTGL
jgi:rhamnosyltransferase subunit B